MATDLTTFRSGTWITWAKVIVLGSYCLDDSTQTLEDVWSGGQPALISLDLLGKKNDYILAPTYTYCLQSITNLSYEFYIIDDS